MIVLKTTGELALMREAGAISAGALKVAGEAVEPGVSTWEIDRIAHEYILRHGATPTFLGYGGFPATACISVNDEVIHGIPSKKRVLREGDIVSIDLGATIHGYVGDNAATFAVGDISAEAKRLIDTTRESLYEGIARAVAEHICGSKKLGCKTLFQPTTMSSSVTRQPAEKDGNQRHCRWVGNLEDPS